MKVDKNDIWIRIIFGSLEKLTILAIVLKLLNILKLDWALVLLPLWAALILGALIGLWWFLAELPEVIKSDVKPNKEIEEELID